MMAAKVNSPVRGPAFHEIEMLFDPDWYLNTYPDIRRQFSSNPLAHYLRYGIIENRRPGPLFDPVFYGTQVPKQIVSGGIIGLPETRRPLIQHFLRVGGLKGLNPVPIGFDSTWYMNQHPEVKEQGKNPLIHWLETGWKRGYDPAPEFDLSYYLEQNPDAAVSGINPLVHYITWGYKEGRDPDPISPKPWNPSGVEDVEYPTVGTDVLFVNGVYRLFAPHPPRFRIDHQIEQLNAMGLTAQSVYTDDLTVDMVAQARLFVLYRCPVTPTLREFIAEAHRQNKKCFFDCDDLIFDVRHTGQLSYIQDMSPKERSQYDEGVWGYRNLLELCDGAITSTSTLADQMRQVTPAVLVNRNVASEEMVARAADAVERIPRNDDGVLIGYFSGSLTHNDDFAMITPALVALMDARPNVRLKLAGPLDPASELARYRDRIVTAPFMGWRAMFDELATVDINLAPLTPTVFNAAKSENKWIEAALVGVPTVASDVGAFADMVEDGQTGLLAGPDGWLEALERLVDDASLRQQLGTQAHDFVLGHCVTTSRPQLLADLVRSNMAPAIAFAVQGMVWSGGMRVVSAHIDMLRARGYNAFLMCMTKDDDEDAPRDPEVLDAATDPAMHLDALVATFWPTACVAQRYPYTRARSYLVQNRETEFHETGDRERARAMATYSCPELRYLTVSRWCQGWLADEFGQESTYVPNGIDLDLFARTERRWDKPRKIRLLLEGDCTTPWRNLDESFAIVDQLDPADYEVWYMSYGSVPKPGYRVDRFLHGVPADKVAEVYAQCDILLKSSIVESFSYPPLEMMATGGYVVVRPNGGNTEYLRDEQNCLFYRPGDVDHAVAQIKRIVADAAVRNTLDEGAKATVAARDWRVLEPAIVSVYEQLMGLDVAH